MCEGVGVNVLLEGEEADIKESLNRVLQAFLRGLFVRAIRDREMSRLARGKR